MSRSWNCIVITGASRGFGRAVAISFARQIKGACHFILTGRSLEDLETTQQQIEQHRLQNVDTSVTLLSADLADIQSIESISDSLFNSSISKYPERKYSKIVFINNAGSLGQLKVILVYLCLCWYP